MQDGTSSDILHASAVALNDRGCLILGPSGSGKSSLALRLVALGATLVADDRVCLTAEGETVVLSAPEGLPPAIEARQVGLLNAPLGRPARLELVIDMSQIERERLPEPHDYEIFAQRFPCLHKSEGPDFHFAVAHYLRYGPANL